MENGSQDVIPCLPKFLTFFEKFPYWADVDVVSCYPMYCSFSTWRFFSTVFEKSNRAFCDNGPKWFFHDIFVCIIHQKKQQTLLFSIHVEPKAPSQGFRVRWQVISIWSLSLKNTKREFTQALHKCPKQNSMLPTAPILFCVIAVYRITLSQFEFNWELY